MSPSPSTQALKILAQFLSRIFIPENRNENNVNVGLNSFIADDLESRVTRAMVVVFDEAVERF